MTTGKFKIFLGTVNAPADVKMNTWMHERARSQIIIDILDWKFQQARMGDHSLAILYQERSL